MRLAHERLQPRRRVWKRLYDPALPPSIDVTDYHRAASNRSIRAAPNPVSSFHRQENLMRAFHFAPCALIVLALAGPVRADDKAADEKTGLPTGAKAPAFTLKDQ